jgi:ribose transport system substrate-binding protein
MCLLTTALGASACGSSSSSSTSSAAGTPAASTQSSSAAVAEATKILAPYTGHPSAFPATIPLKAAPVPGTRVAYLTCSEPACGLFGNLFAGAAKVAGVQFNMVNAGSTASDLAAAWDTVLSQKPGAVIVPANLGPSTWSQSTKDKIKASKIPVIMTGVVDADRYGFGNPPYVSVSGAPVFKLLGRVQAAYIVAHEKLPTKIAYATIPGLSFSPIVFSSFNDTLQQLCPQCEVSTIPLPITGIGTTAPQQIVSFLQAHPDVNVVTTVSQDGLHGLTPALKASGLHPDVIGVAGDPENLEDLKAGAEKANIESDLAVAAWLTMDAALREIEGQRTPPNEITPVQVLTPSDVTFDPSHGWTGYPDFAQRFAKLWHP